MKTLKQIVPSLWIRLLLAPAIMILLVFSVLFAMIFVMSGERPAYNKILTGLNKFLGLED